MKRCLNGFNVCASHVAGPVAGGLLVMVTGSGLPWARVKSLLFRDSMLKSVEIGGKFILRALCVLENANG